MSNVIITPTNSVRFLDETGSIAVKGLALFAEIVYNMEELDENGNPVLLDCGIYGKHSRAELVKWHDFYVSDVKPAIEAANQVEFDPFA
ncbi:MAG TPA: hypothetical protein VHI13_18985 [Candidatus Kapabacteria bacterium]|nr:hypothetical protein [Candidatus Kapabacteria bacterium]